MKFNKFTLPLMKRVYPKLINDKLIGVQPMVRPVFIPAHIDIVGGIIQWTIENFNLKYNVDLENSGIIRFVIDKITVELECRIDKFTCRCYDSKADVVVDYAMQPLVIPAVSNSYDFNYEDPAFFDKLFECINKDCTRIRSCVGNKS